MKTIAHSLRSALPLMVIVVGAAIHLGFLLQIFHPKSFAGFLFPLVVLTPWILLLASQYIARNRIGQQYIAMLISMIYLLFGAWAYWDVIYGHPDPQGGLVFVVVPVLGTIVTLLMILALLAFRPKSTYS